MARGLASDKSRAILDLGSRERIFNEDLRRFQAGLRESDFLNRFSLATAQPQAFGLGAQLAQTRLANRTTTTRDPGGLATGLAIAGTAANLFSPFRSGLSPFAPEPSFRPLATGSPGVVLRGGD